MKLSEQHLSTDHCGLLARLSQSDKLLIIQDLDGVCMGLVRDPVNRSIDPAYLRAASAFGDQFFVLTNGEHEGKRGVNRIVEAALGAPEQVAAQRMYLPGLAAGGVQWQDRDGVVSHPGVTDAEIEFLRQRPAAAAAFLTHTLQRAPFGFSSPEIEKLVETCVLDNLVSPTLNLNQCHQRLQNRPERFRALQLAVHQFMREQIHEAEKRDLGASFFVHLAPNLGQAAGGEERLLLCDGASCGTHDFQLMLGGGVKQAGVAVLLNEYFYRRCGEYPLGEGFCARHAPADLADLLALIRSRFDAGQMPRIIGVGDTVTSAPDPLATDSSQRLRGGSDRGFLTLIQEIGRVFDTDNAVLLVDSSHGELKRPGLADAQAISDAADPLRLNFAFPGGHSQYVDFFVRLSPLVANRF